MTNDVVLQIRVPWTLRDELAAVARENQRSLSGQARYVLSKHLERAMAERELRKVATP